jgi:glycosyltransferase involved in cell wall biosynthesis
MGASPTISVVIPTYNRVDRWPAVLRGLASQTFDFDDFEVVIVSDGSTDGTNEFLMNASTPYELILETQDNAGPAAARNRGVELARSAVIVFLDDDIVATPPLIERHSHWHRENPDQLAVIGPMLSPPDAELSAPIRWEQAMLYKQYDAMARGDYPPVYRQFFTGNASVPRARVLAAGGFDLRYRRAEDIELAYRMSLDGLRFVYDADAAAFHYAERSFRSWLHNAHEYGVNDVMFSHEHPKEGLLERTRKEFAGRHRLVRWTTRACVARPWLEPPSEQLLRAAARAAEAIHAHGLTQSALSGLYNLAYYCGMAEELGGAAEFSAKVADPPQESMAA